MIERCGFRDWRKIVGRRHFNQPKNSYYERTNLTAIEPFLLQTKEKGKSKHLYILNLTPLSKLSLPIHSLLIDSLLCISDVLISELRSRCHIIRGSVLTQRAFCWWNPRRWRAELMQSFQSTEKTEKYSPYSHVHVLQTWISNSGQKVISFRKLFSDFIERPIYCRYNSPESIPIQSSVNTGISEYRDGQRVQ